MNNAALNAPVEVFVWTYIFIFLRIILGNGIAESYGHLAFWETTQYVAEVGSPSGTLTYVSLLCLWLSLFLISSQFSVAFSFLLVFDFQKFDHDVSRSEYPRNSILDTAYIQETLVFLPLGFHCLSCIYLSKM